MTDTMSTGKAILRECPGCKGTGRDTRDSRYLCLCCRGSGYLGLTAAEWLELDEAWQESRKGEA